MPRSAAQAPTADNEVGGYHQSQRFYIIQGDSDFGQKYMSTTDHASGEGSGITYFLYKS